MNRPIQLSLFLFIILVSSAHAQFPQTLRLDATAPTIVRSVSTRPGWQYIVTVSGTYSMWPTYQSHGVDGAYVYDVPAEEIQAFRWPPLFIYPIPHWVGDTLVVPPFDYPGQQFKFRTRDNIGFRYNGQPLADRGLDASHRYQTTVVGDGGPIELQILDSAYSIREGKIIPRYEDNSGALTIVIEERPYMNVCGVQTFCSGGQMHLAIAATLLEYDSTGRPRNALKSANQLAVAVDGLVIQADSISCASRTPVSYTLVIDRSGSMRFSYDGATDRLTALKRAAHGFLKTMKPNDRASLITFSYDDDITLDVASTSDTGRIGRGIDAINPLGGTAWRDAAWHGLDLAAKDYNPLKAVVLLTDGDDTHSRRSIDQVVAKARLVNVPVFAIGMALVDSSEKPLRYLAAQSNGRFFQARDQRAIDSAFNNLSRAIESDECCTLYVTLPKSVTARS
ncbi:MAG: VWA domain-containing protein, partial [bacterium]|nr:VWA domain-containing protein [Candidatus Kapabacteria bacterium]